MGPRRRERGPVLQGVRGVGFGGAGAAPEGGVRGDDRGGGGAREAPGAAGGGEGDGRNCLGAEVKRVRSAGAETQLGAGKRRRAVRGGLQDESVSFELESLKHEGTNLGFYNSGTWAKPQESEMTGSTAVNQRADEERRERAQRAAAENGSRAQDAADAEVDKKVYRGASEYRKYIQPGRYVGPQKSSSNVRCDVVIDYARDICKDYKETGYCGYGDTCKFLHDRSEYKTGWQLDREWEAQEKKRRDRLLGIEQSDEEEEEEEEVKKRAQQDVPFACHICRNPFRNPVVTECGHYFCEDCALARYAEDKRCAVCKEQTLGIFNSASAILKRKSELERTKQEERQKKKRWIEQLESGEDAPQVV
ncbi:uncharacterized protein LOC126318364 [Schistocerca gregaria]|uniref:uncharacterized protein LOC126318364 n=1 Tax=Schistocerca gregaria TaxID=7010 RepID=UPI00211E9B76|nr:uncharacterized protein LOC126318364 [Schistocerca gregaria]